MTDNSSIDTSVTNMWRTWRAFRRGKKPSRAILAFEADLERQLLLLVHDITTGTYRHGTYIHKIVNEKKRRDIQVATVRDRVVHRLLYDYLVGRVDARFDPDVWSCRSGKGLHGAIRRAQQLASRHQNAWVCRADVRKFFDHVDHLVLRQCLVRIIHDDTALWLADEIVASYTAPGKSVGMPIGNLTSQLFANVYLHELDRFVRHTLRPLGYIRYGDDVVLFAASQREAMRMQGAVEFYLRRELHLALHAANGGVYKVSRGVYFLGHRIYPDSVVIAPSTILRLQRRMSLETVASYQAQRLSRRERREIAWFIAAKISILRIYAGDYL